MFAKDNQNFDHAKFIDAVMKESNWWTNYFCFSRYSLWVVLWWS
jgi:hypothetical protein